MSILGIIAGVGILFLKSIFRKILLVTVVYGILAHTIEAPFLFKNIIEYFKLTYPQTYETQISFMWPSFITSFLFTFWLLYYFTRPKIKAIFS